MKPLILDYQERVGGSDSIAAGGPKTMTDSREELDFQLNVPSASLGTETFTKSRENGDTDFDSSSNFFC